MSAMPASSTTSRVWASSDSRPLDVAEQGVQGAGRDAGAGGELLGGPSRWAGTDDPPAARW